MRLKTCLGCRVVVLASLWLSLAHAADKGRPCSRMSSSSMAGQRAGPLAVNDSWCWATPSRPSQRRRSPPADADPDACVAGGAAR